MANCVQNAIKTPNYDNYDSYANLCRLPRMTVRVLMTMTVFLRPFESGCCHAHSR